MKKTTLLTALLTAASPLFAQTWLDLVNSRPDVDLNTTKSAFANYWQGRQEERGTGIKPYKRWEWFWETRLSANQPSPKRSIAWEEWTRYRNSAAALRTAQTQNAAWTFSGPASTQSGYYGIGRLNTIAFHPTDANTFYVGAPAGGLWKTTNGGTSWTALTDHLPVIGVADIAIDPSNPNIIYLVTGDCDGGDTYSIGVLKSTDGGATWNTTGMSWTVTAAKLLKRIQINPANPQMLWLAANDGLWRTTNGGTTWSLVQSGSFVDIELNPADPNVVYAASYATNSLIYRSANAGASFSQVATITGGRRLNLAVTKHNPQIVQVLACNSSGGLHSLWKSSDAGQSFAQYLTGTTSNNMLHSSATGAGSGGQGTYDLAFNVNPLDSNEVWLGGVNTWSSEDGGATWRIKTIWSGGQAGSTGALETHADKHFQVFHPITNAFYECNDGGLYRTTNKGVSWTDLSTGLGISQIYRIGLSATPGIQVLAGLQDNSTKEFKNNAWLERHATGDGFESLYDPADATVMYTSSYYGSIRRSTTGGTGWTIIANSNGAGVHSQGPWLTPYIINPLDRNTLLVAKREIYRSNNRGTAWTQLTNFGTTATATAVAYAPSDTNTIYAAFGSRLNRSTDGGTTWTVATNASATISYIAVHPTNPQRLWITLPVYSGNKVMASTDGGTTWTALNGTLPNLPVNCIVYQKGSNDGLYIGTDVGVYYRDNTMTDWTPFQNGLPNVIVNELEISYGDNKIWAGTYGRGLWSSHLYGAAPCTAPAVPTGGGTQTVCAGTPASLMATVAAGNVVDWYATATGGSPISTGATTYTTQTAGTYYAEARNSATNCVSAGRTAFTLNVTPLPATPVISYLGSATFCAGASLNLQSSAADSYQWYRDGGLIAGATAQSHTASLGGAYTVTTTSGGCASAQSAPLVVTVTPAPPQPTISVNGSQLTSSAATGNQWYLNGTAISGATGQVYNATTNGTYTVSATVSGCTSAASAPQAYTAPVVATPGLNDLLTVAPNPVRNQLEIVYSGPAANFDLELIDMKGRIVKQGLRFTQRYTLNMRPFAAGHYVVRIVNTVTKEQTLRTIVKQ